MMPETRSYKPITPYERRKYLMSDTGGFSSDVSKKRIVFIRKLLLGQYRVPRSQSITSMHPPNNFPRVTPLPCNQCQPSEFFFFASSFPKFFLSDHST